MTGIATRLTVRQQLSRNEVFDGKPLAVSAKFPSGRLMRSGEVLKNLPHLLASGIPVEVRTPAGNLLDPAALIGKTPKQIDNLAAGLDRLLGVDKLRAPEIILPELVRIEAGTFPVKGSHLFSQGTKHAADVTMSGFEVSKYPVTVAEFRKFVEGSGYEIAGQGADELKELLADHNKVRHPVVLVNREDREAYAKWRRETTGQNWFILSAAQQEFIRRGNSGRTYPWGDNWRQAPYFNTNRTAPVDAWPEGATPEGVSGLCIVWEATRSYYGDYDPKVVKDPEGPASGESFEVRGGSAWYGSREDFDGAGRDDGVPGDRGISVGFRLGKD